MPLCLLRGIAVIARRIRPECQEPHHCLSPIPDPELCIGDVQVIPYGAGPDPEFGGNFVVRQTPGREGQDLSLPASERLGGDSPPVVK